MKTKVAIVLMYFGTGGAENMVSQLASNLDLSEADVEVICIYGSKLNNRLENKVLEHGVNIKYINKGKGFSIKAMNRLWDELNAFKPNVVHTHLSAGVYCAPWVLMHKVRMLHTVHNTPQCELIGPKKALMGILYKTKKVRPVAISAEIQRMTKEMYKLSYMPELVYNPVDVKFISSIDKKSKEEIVLLNIGRLAKQKNQKLLIDAFEVLSKKNNKLQLKIVGDGPLKDELHKYVRDKSLQDKIIFTGNVDNVQDYYAEADIFVLSSTYEGLPLVVLEAMAASLPIVSTNVGGVKDIVTNNGILVEAENRDELVKGLNELINDKEKRSALGKKSFNNAFKYDVSEIAKQYLELYKKYS